MTDPDLTQSLARTLTIDATLHEHRAALRTLLARAFDGGYAAGELAARARIRELEAALRAIVDDIDWAAWGRFRGADQTRIGVNLGLLLEALAALAATPTPD